MSRKRRISLVRNTVFRFFFLFSYSSLTTGGFNGRLESANADGAPLLNCVLWPHTYGIVIYFFFRFLRRKTKKKKTFYITNSNSIYRSKICYRFILYGFADFIIRILKSAFALP